MCIPQSAATKCTKSSSTRVNGSREILIVSGVVGFFGDFFLGIVVWGCPRFPGQLFRIDLGKKVSQRVTEVGEIEFDGKVLEKRGVTFPV